MNTMVVNCYAGPGAGKTTCAWEVGHNSRKKVLIPNMFRSMPRNWFGRENMMYLKTKNIFLQNKPNVLKDFVER